MKKFISVCWGLLFVFTLIVGAVILSQNLYAGQGHWVYNEAGEHIGCVSPGTDCAWGA